VWWFAGGATTPGHFLKPFAPSCSFEPPLYDSCTRFSK
jgi:hypothetical protein